MIRNCFLILIAALSSSAVSFSGNATAATEKKPLPYLGPGAEKLSKEEYERIYKNYIQTSILLGYPFFKEKAPPCDQALGTIFRGAGLFGYPVPAEAQQVQRSSRFIKGKRVETYEMAGLILQISRNAKSDALERLFLLNSSSPKATRRLSGFAKKEILELEKDPITGLERVRGIPVGYPHPFLTQDGQGLFVRDLRFNGKPDGCEPLGFQDNSWAAGFDLSEQRCTELQVDAEKVWSEQMSPSDFASRELDRMKERALKSARAGGTDEKEAKALIEKHFTRPFTNEINIVGSAMRNLAQCNLLALGKAGKTRSSGSKESSHGAEGAGGSGSAQ